MRERLIIAMTVAALLGILASCHDKCETVQTYSIYEPVYQSLDDIRSGIDVGVPVDMAQPGKIYLYGSLLFINEPGKGVHIVDNSDRSNPRFIQFITVPGNFDMAVKDNVLYVDSYVDLVALDISDVSTIREVHRAEEVFPNYNIQFGFVAEDGLVITDWEWTETVEINDDCISTGGSVVLEFGIAMQDAGPTLSSAAAPSPGPTGIGGSMARFAVSNDNLYVVDFYDLSVFNISQPQLPEFTNRVNIGWDIETIFPFKDHLFIGARTGMHIFSISDPAAPQYVSNFLHVSACDPVVANDEYAFVTLRSGNACEGFTNELEVIDIGNVESPFLRKSYPMQNPHGLGIDDNVLFVSEGDFGLKVYDITDINTIDENQIAYFSDIHSFDVIPWDNVLISIGNDGLYQYDYSSLTEMELLSHLPIIEQP